MAEREKELAVVCSQEQLAEGIFSMWIRTKAAMTAVPGQFLSMYTNDKSKLLPRPISICEIDREKGMIRVVYRVTGEHTGTEEFSRMREGDTLPVIGPLGNGFPLEEARGRKAFLIGGGIGVPPILELAKQINCEKQIIVGYRDDQTFLKKDLSKMELSTFLQRTEAWGRPETSWMRSGRTLYRLISFMPVVQLRC